MSTKEPLYSQYYLSLGQGPVVLLLHGLFGNVSMWARTIDVLQSNYRVIVPRLPIFSGPAHADLESLVHTLHEFIAWHQLSNVSLVGHGAGGILALHYATLHPANVNKIVVSGCPKAPVPIWSDPDENEINEFTEDYTQSLVDGARSQHHELHGERSDQMRNGVHTGKLGNNAASPLNRLDHATLLVWGLDDLISPPEVALHFNNILPNADLRFIEKCGHLPMVEQPDIFNQYVHGFLSVKKSKAVTN